MISTWASKPKSKGAPTAGLAIRRSRPHKVSRLSRRCGAGASKPFDKAPHSFEHLAPPRGFRLQCSRRSTRPLFRPYSAPDLPDRPRAPCKPFEGGACVAPDPVPLIDRRATRCRRDDGPSIAALLLAGPSKGGQSTGGVAARLRASQPARKFGCLSGGFRRENSAALRGAPALLVAFIDPSQLWTGLDGSGRLTDWSQLAEI